MKFLAIFVALLGFAPTIMDRTLSALRAPAPTRVFPTKTYNPSNVFNAGRAVLQVPPTSASRVRHNNVGQLGALPFPSFYGLASSIVFSCLLSAIPADCTLLCIVGTAISISTALGATSNCTVAATGDTISNHNRCILQRHWSNSHHLRRIDFGWVISVCQLLLPFLTVGAALLRERTLHRRSLQSEPVSAPLDPRSTIKCRVPHTRTTSQPTFLARGPIEAGPLLPNATPTLLQKAHGLRSSRSSVEVLKTTGLVGSCKDIVDLPVALKQPHRVIAWITLYSVEGFLSLDLCSPNSECDDAIQWTINFHPRDRLPPTRSPTHPEADVTTNERLLNILYHGIPAYHPWAPQFTGVLKIPGVIVNGSNNGVGLDATAIVPRTTQEDGRTTYAKGENEPETHHRRKKPHRGGQRAARMKRQQAPREAAEAPEAGPSGPN